MPRESFDAPCGGAPPLLGSRLARGGRSVVVGLMLLALPGAATLVSSVAVAQPNPDTMKEIARQRYADGVKAFDAGKFDEARAAFFQSYELTKVPAVLLNLGLSEVKGNHPVEGGNHLLQFLHEYKEAKPDQIASANQGIEDAKKRAAQIAVTVSVAGADVSVDGALIGKSPLADPVFVEPGSRTVVASLNGKDGMARVDAKKGAVADASIVITGAGGDVTPPPVGPTNPSQPPTSPSGPQPPLGTQPPGPTPPVEPPSTQEHESFGHWYGHKPLAWVGTGLAAVGLGLGIGFTAAAASANSTTQSLADAIRTDVAGRNFKGAPCSSDGTHDATRYAKACASLRDSMSKHNVDLGVAVGGWVAFGIGTVGTVTYVLVDWLPSKKGSAPDEAPPPVQGVHVEPVIGPGYMGLTGRF